MFFTAWKTPTATAPSEEYFVVIKEISPALYCGRGVIYTGSEEHKPQWLTTHCRPAKTLPENLLEPAWRVDGDKDAREAAEAAAIWNVTPKPDLARADLRARYGWDDGTINYAMDLRLLAKPDQSELRTSHLAGPMTDIVEYWSPRAVEGLDRHLTRLFPNIVIKTFVR